MKAPAWWTARRSPDLGYADDFVLLARTAMGLQRLLDAVAKFCTCMGMVIHIQKTKVIAFGHLYPVPFQWTINGETLETVLQIKYLGVVFTAHAGLSLTFGPLKTKMCAAWALLKRQYGRLAMSVLCGPPLQALHGVCSQYGVIWL